MTLYTTPRHLSLTSTASGCGCDTRGGSASPGSLMTPLPRTRRISQSTLSCVIVFAARAVALDRIAQFEAATGSVQTLVDDLLPAGFEIQTATVSKGRSITDGSVRAGEPRDPEF